MYGRRNSTRKCVQRLSLQDLPFLVAKCKIQDQSANVSVKAGESILLHWLGVLLQPSIAHNTEAHKQQQYKLEE